MSNGSVPLLGPWFAPGELEEGGFVVRHSVFLPVPPGGNVTEAWQLPASESRASECCRFEGCRGGRECRFPVHTVLTCSPGIDGAPGS